MSLQATAGRQWWDRWFLPYLVLVLSPVLTLPVSGLLIGSLPYCLVDEPSYRLRHFEIALLPSLADLLPFLWLASSTLGVRRAAIVAGLIGSVRFAIPQVLTLIEHIEVVRWVPSGDALHPPEPELCPEYTIHTFFILSLVFIILALWLVSALIVAVILLRARRRPVDHPD